MPLLSPGQRALLLSNGRCRLDALDTEREFDFQPVVKLFTPWAAATWLLTEIDPHDEDLAFGLCDLGLGTPELGRFSLRELQGLTGPGGLTVEVDRYFTAAKTLKGYVDEALKNGRIVARASPTASKPAWPASKKPQTANSGLSSFSRPA